MRRWTASVALGFAIIPRALPAAPPSHGLAETIERWEHLRIESNSFAAQNLRLESGNLVVTLSSGSAALVRAGEEIVGVFLAGSGSIEYRSQDPTEFPLLLHNAKSGTNLTPEKAEKSVTVRDSFTEALWLAAGQRLPEPKGASGPSIDPAFQRHLEKLRRIRMPPFSHAFARQALDGPSAPLVFAEFSGGKTDLLYRLDADFLREERLSFLRRSQSHDPELKNNLYPTALSQRSIGLDPRAPRVPAFVLADVRVELLASSGKDATLTVAETIVPQGKPQTVFRFDLLSTTYSVIGSGVLQPRSFRLRSVEDAAGRSVPFHHSHGELLIALAAPASPDQPFQLKFQIDGDFLVRPGGDNFWILGVEPWFPQPEILGQYYTWHAVVKVPKPFVPFASGSTASRRTEGDLNVVETQVDKPVQFAVVLAGKYEFEEEKKKDVTIRVATYAFHNSRAMKQLANLAASIIEYYEAFLGPFPFPEFDILEINDYGFGQAPPGVMFITREAFQPIQQENQYFSQGVNERFAHEIAHQYWGHVVKMPGETEEWLSESFAEYCAALFLRQFKGKAAYDGLMAHWKAGARHAREVAPIPLANEVYEPLVGGLLRFELLYEKGPYLLASLNRQLGDDAFFTFLKSYQKSFRWKFGSTKTVTGMLQFLTKKDFGPFFEANYWGTGMPDSEEGK
jgi:hypothetical protein